MLIIRGGGTPEHRQRNISQKLLLPVSDRRVNHLQIVSAPCHRHQIRAFSGQHPVLSAEGQDPADKRPVGIVAAGAVFFTYRNKVQIGDRLNIDIQIVAKIGVIFCVSIMLQRLHHRRSLCNGG